MRSKASRWRLFQYPTCWRNSRFSRRKHLTSAHNSTTSRLEFSTGSINSGEEPLGQQICTSWPFITNLVTETAEIWEEAGSLLSTTDRPVRTGSAKLYNKGGIEQEKRTQFPAGGIGRGAGEQWPRGRWGPTTLPGRSKVVAPSAFVTLKGASIPCFSDFSLDQLRPQLSGHGYPAQRAANTSRPRSDRFWLLELRVSRTFLDQSRPKLFRPLLPS